MQTSIFGRAALVMASLMLGAVPTIASAGTLASTASAMQPGAWAELTGMNGWNNGSILVPSEFGCTASDYVTQYAEKAAWDPINQRVLFVGQAHGSCYGGRFVIYQESSNTWSQGPWPSGVCQSGTANSPCFSHAYGHNTADPVTGDMYFRQSYTMKFFRYRGNAWSSIPAPSMQSSQCCGALEYFPEMGRLLFLDGDWGLWAYNPSSNAWTALANTNAANATAGLRNLPMPPTIVFMQYNPVDKSVLFGGGSQIYKIASNGTITQMKAPPVGLGVTRAVTSVDPVSGKYLSVVGSQIYQYDVAADTWSGGSTIPSAFTALDGVGDGLVAVPLKNFGVIMYIKYNFANSKVYLYKHSPFTVRQPNPPGNVNAV